MSDKVILVENLGKKYRIQHQELNGRRYKALRDVLADKTKGVVRRLWMMVVQQKQKPESKDQKSGEDFWALKNVSFEVKRGEVIGIIGRNGAGKSTLLKILSRITEPTEGRVRIKGRVASLLEVGTGFHPELTGRENIFLNGAILGMTKSEIRAKFDEIVAFAEIEKFLDTPVKRYSSGMYVRLAFAVAAHLEPEILIVDEVLAVGDAQFQEKCLGKMRELSSGTGRTVLFVSHNLGSIRQLCSAAVMLDGGRVATLGPPAEVIGKYAATPIQSSSTIRRSGSGRLRFQHFHCENDARQKIDRIFLGEGLTFVLELNAREAIRSPRFSLAIKDSLGQYFAHITSEEGSFTPRLIAEGRHVVRIKVESLNFCPGRYCCDLWAEAGEELDYIRDCLDFEIDPNPHSKRREPYPTHVRCFPSSIWISDISHEWLSTIRQQRATRLATDESVST
jgi:lipopolysaccharide transport system ATP-binding protein